MSCRNSKIALYILPARRQPSPRGIAARRPGCRPRPAAHPLLLTPCCSLPAAYTYAKRVLIPQDNNLLGKKHRTQKPSTLLCSVLRRYNRTVCGYNRYPTRAEIFTYFYILSASFSATLCSVCRYTITVFQSKSDRAEVFV